MSITNTLIPIAQIAPHPRNYRSHPDTQLAQLGASYTRFGQFRSVVVVARSDGSYTQVAGHGIVEAMKRNGATEVRVDVLSADTSPEDIEAILIADNTLGGGASDDETMLATMLKEQQDAGFDLAAMGGDDETLRQMLSELGDAYLGDEQEEEENDYGLPPEGPTRTNVGELWQLGKHRLLVDDCTKPANIHKLMQGKCAGMAWCDPPFGIDLTPQRKLNTSIAGDGKFDAQQIWRDFLPLLSQTLLDNTSAFLCQDWSAFDWTLPIIREHFTIKDKVVWFKTQWGLGYYFRPQHEDVLYCWKGTPPTPDDAISDVWEIARSNKPEHAAEKPVALVQKAIEFASKEDDVVIDWFAGVGATVIACERTNRFAYMMELEPRYCDVILRRYETETHQTAVLLAPAQEAVNV